MYYDYPEEEFYPESEYQEQIDALKEAIKSSVKSEILEEMNRLRAENEKLQGVKEHFEEVKRITRKRKTSATGLFVMPSTTPKNETFRIDERPQGCKVES